MESMRKLYVLSTTLVLKPELKKKKKAGSNCECEEILHEDYSVVLMDSILGW